MNAANQNQSKKPKSRMPSRKSAPLASKAVTGLSIVGAGMFALALPNLISGDGVVAITKGVLLGTGALIASLGVNRLAIDKGAPLTSLGMPGAGILSVSAIALVGFAMWGATYSGMVLPDVETLQLEEHNRDYDRFVDGRAQMAAEAGRLAPVMRSIQDDLIAKEACEIATSCVSLRGSGGVGRVSFAVGAERQRAGSILEQVEAGETVRKSTLRTLNDLSARYQEIVDDADLSMAERRKLLQAIESERGQVVSRLDAAMPIGLLEGYISELENGRSISERPVASRTLNDLMAGYATGLDRVLGKLESGNQARPEFPRKTGVTDTFAYIGHFLPIALITFCVDVAFALILWTITLMVLVWGWHRDNPDEEETPQDGENLSSFLNQNLLDDRNVSRLPTPRAPHNRGRGGRS